jgi:hypothetical protein
MSLPIPSPPTPERTRLKRIAGIAAGRRTGGGRTHGPAGHPGVRVDGARGRSAWDPGRFP